MGAIFGLLFLGIIVYGATKALGALIGLLTGRHAKLEWALVACGLADVSELLAVFCVGAMAELINWNAGEKVPGVAILGVMALSAFIVAYFRKSTVVLIAASATLGAWLITQGIAWNHEGGRSALMLPIVINIALLYLLASRFHHSGTEPTKFWRPLLALGTAVVVVASFYGSSTDFLQPLTGSLQNRVFASTGLALFWLLTIALLLASGVLLKQRKLLTLGETVTAWLAAVMFTPIGLVGSLILLRPRPLLVDSFGGTYADRSVTLMSRVAGYGALWLVIANAVIVLQIIWLLRYGYEHRDRLVINVGTGYLVAAIVIKYFDLLFSWMNKTVFFLGLGVVLVGVGQIVNQRIKASHHHHEPPPHVGAAPMAV